MFTNSNTWRKLNYTLLAPIYDLIVGRFAAKRRESIQRASPKPGQRVLLLGAGTGADLEYLPPGPSYVAIDLTPAMLDRLRRRAQRLGIEVEARVMDGMNLEFSDASFDLVILHLILAVIPDPQRCMQEVARVLRPGGRVAILDKFVPYGWRWLALRMLNPLTSLLGTNVNCRFAPLVEGGDWIVESDTSAGYGGLFRIILLRRSGRA